MIGLDTNILVRYLTRDDESQWRQASEIIQQNQPCFIANIVSCELVWVLRGTHYRFQKAEVIETLEAMLHSPAKSLKAAQRLIKHFSDTNKVKPIFPIT